MSEFLSILVRRSLGLPAPQSGMSVQSHTEMDVQPRLASRFEQLSPRVAWEAPGSAAGSLSQADTFEESDAPHSGEPDRKPRLLLPGIGASSGNAHPAQAPSKTVLPPHRIGSLSAHARLSASASPQPPKAGGNLTPIEAQEERGEPTGSHPDASAAPGDAAGRGRRASPPARPGTTPGENTIVPPRKTIGPLPSPGLLPHPARSSERSPQLPVDSKSLPDASAGRPALRSRQRRQGDLPEAALLQEHVEIPARRGVPIENRPALARPAAPAAQPRLLAGSPSVSPLLPLEMGRRSFGLRPAFASEPASEPAIQIHIGRIEIRAALTAPARKQASQPAAPALLSLDEYLRQRSEGGRKP